MLGKTGSVTQKLYGAFRQIVHYFKSDQAPTKTPCHPGAAAITLLAEKGLWSDIAIALSNIIGEDMKRHTTHLSSLVRELDFKMVGPITIALVNKCPDKAIWMIEAVIREGYFKKAANAALILLKNNPRYFEELVKMMTDHCKTSTSNIAGFLIWVSDADLPAAQKLLEALTKKLPSTTASNILKNIIYEKCLKLISPEVIEKVITDTIDKDKISKCAEVLILLIDLAYEDVFYAYQATELLKKYDLDAITLIRGLSLKEDYEGTAKIMIWLAKEEAQTQQEQAQKVVDILRRLSTFLGETAINTLLDKLEKIDPTIASVDIIEKLTRPKFELIKS